jgi:protoheme IX farnesyltransferase
MEAGMKMEATTAVPADAIERSSFAVWSDLVKARLTFLVLLTTLAGFYAGAQGPVDWLLLARTLLGTALVACGAAALNQWWEREHDARMPRTETRPLPAGELAPMTVFVAGGALSIAGLLQLAIFVNLLTSLLGAITLLSYVLVYTPLKRITTLNTAIGAIPGALPPLMGWSAAQDSVSREGWALFAILFFWQLPHFLAIAWLYREEYAKAGYVMLPVRDPDGVRTGRQAVSHTLGLIAVSICPAVVTSGPEALPIAGRVYFFGALLLGLAFLWCAIQFSRELTRGRARQLFFASILYLPLLLGLMAIDKVRH